MIHNPIDVNIRDSEILMEISIDHYWLVSIFQCLVLISDIHYDAFWIINRTLTIVYKQIEIWSIIPKNLVSIFGWPVFCCLRNFIPIFLLPLDETFLTKIGALSGKSSELLDDDLWCNYIPWVLFQWLSPYIIHQRYWLDPISIFFQNAYCRKVIYM